MQQTTQHVPRRFWPLITLVVLFGVSIIVRLSSFGIRPLEDSGYTPFARFNNTEVWLHNKAVFDIYSTHTVPTHKFAAYIAADPLNEFLRNKKDVSLIVYSSFPSAHFVVPYLLFTALHITPTLTALQLFSLGIQMLCVGLTYYLVWLLTRNKLISIAAASVYIFSTATLHHHMNVYWAHQLLMPVFMGALVTFVRQKGYFQWWQGLAFGLIMSLITWTGAVASTGFALYGAYKWWRTRNKKYAAHLFMIFGAACALALITLQVLLTSGTTLFEYAQKILHRAQARSAGAAHTAPAILLWNLWNDLCIDYGGYALIAYTTYIKTRLKVFEWEVLFVASFPLIETFILLEHDTVYGFGLLKWIVPIIIILAVTANRYITTKRRMVIFATALLTAHVLHSILFLLVYTRT